MGVRIGLLGGSFDPVHLAHVKLARAALQALALDTVQFIPAANPWQRRPLAADAHDRLAMLELATRNDSRLEVNPIETRRGGKTYTVDTLRELATGPRYYWILGGDQLGNFCTWHQWQEIADLVCLAVAQRPGSELVPPQPLRDHLAGRGHELTILPFEPTAISSTLIRQRLAAGDSTDGLLDVAVAQYIRQKGLYQAPVPR